MFSCEFCEFSKNIFFTEHLQATASKVEKLFKLISNWAYLNITSISFVTRNCEIREFIITCEKYWKCWVNVASCLFGMLDLAIPFLDITWNWFKRFSNDPKPNLLSEPSISYFHLFKPLSLWSSNFWSATEEYIFTPDKQIGNIILRSSSDYIITHKLETTLKNSICKLDWAINPQTIWVFTGQ